MKELQERISRLTPVKQALLNKMLREKTKRLSSQKTIPKRENQEPPPLSSAQARIWFLEQLDPGNVAYNRPSALRFNGRLDTAVLERCLNEIIRRHEVLRGSFPDLQGKPVPVIAPTSHRALVRVNLVYKPENQKEAEAQRLAVEEAQRPFDLINGPLVRATLLQLNETDHILLLTIHHIIFDGWSMQVLCRELSVLYEAFSAGQPSPLSELPIQYWDFAQWQNERLKGEEIETDLEFWKKQLEGAPPTSQFPTDRPRPNIQTFHGATHSIILLKNLCDSVKSLSQRLEATLFMTLLAAFKTLMYRYSGSDDIVVGIPVAGRDRLETELLIGVFTNTLALRTHLAGNPTFRELLSRVRKVSIDGYSHQNLPFEQLIEKLHIVRDLSRSPLFQTLFNFRNIPKQTREIRGLEINNFEFDSGIALVDLSLEIILQGDVISCRFIYNTDLFEASTIERMAGHYQMMLEGIAANPDLSLSELPLLTEAERHKLLVEWNNTGADYPGDECIHELFEAQVEKTPDAIAVVFEDQMLTYRELNSRANQLAHYLRKQGVGPEVLVGICVERSIEMIVSILGILKAGGAYVPLEPDYPKERLKFMLEDTQATVVLTQLKLVDDLPVTRSEVICLDVPEHLASEAKMPDTNPARGVTAENLAYVIYTSGSTGWPKGVAVEHRQIVNYVRGICERIEFEPAWHFAIVSTIAADLGNTVVFPAVCTGGCLHVISKEQVTDSAALAEYFERNSIDCLKIVPSHLAALMTGPHPEKLMPRHRLILGGEASRCEWVEGLRKLAPDCIIFNHYGPTETTVGVLTYQVGNEQPCLPSGTLPLGLPLSNTQVYILDGHQGPVPIGVAGEIYIGGDGVARGYLNRSELTAERFVPNRLCNEPGSLLYRTGDRARYLADGNIEFLGRIDQQVKIHGFRIEPGEIEAALGDCPGVRDAAVIAREDASGNTRLVAYIVPRQPLAVVSGRRSYQLPNKLLVAHLNKNETDYIYREIFELQAYFRHGITVNDGDVVFDVGANIGLFTVFVNQICRRPRVYAFEPNPVVYEIASVNARAYGVDVRVLPWGLSSEDTTAELTFFEGFSMLSGFYSDVEKEKQVVKNFMINQQRTGQADMSELIEQADELLDDRFKVRNFTSTLRTLSGVIAEEKVDRIDLLKINVEKSEWHVLQGIEEKDWSKIRQMVLEVDLREHLPPITALLEKHGYEYVIEQDALLDGTELCYIYAIRPSADRRLIRKQAAGEHLLKLPVFSDTVLSAYELRQHLRRRLPDYMVPSAFVSLDALPLTPNGKIDRRTLPTPDSERPDREDSYVAPRSPIEEVLASIWCDVLRLKEVSIHDNFFELGGHSLLAAQVISRLRKAFQVQIPLRSLFEYLTIAGLAIQIIQSQDEITDPEEMDRLLAELEGSAPGSVSRFKEIEDERDE